MLEEIINMFPDYQFILVDGFDKAVIGFDYKANRIIYSVSKCIDILKTDMCTGEAWQYLEFNCFDAFQGDNSPIWCYDIP